MENQGYEDEQSRGNESAVLSREFSDEKLAVSLASFDGHVYEDILPGVEDVANVTSRRSNSFRVVENPPQGGEPISHIYNVGPFARTSDEFRRNLTLPIRRGTGASSSTSRERNRRQDDRVAGGEPGIFDLPEENERPTDYPHREPARTQTEPRPNRRRRKKDCKHCRKAIGPRGDAILQKNQENQERNFPTGNSDVQTNPLTVFTISETVRCSPSSTLKFIEYERNEVRSNVGHVPENNEEKALIVPEKNNRPGMRVNSIYSQERWYAKEAPVFFTNVKEHASFQRAYSLPVRTPSSQNRVNLRRSVRGEPPPHPARLHKHRHGWTLHLARPLEGSGCTRSLVLLLIVVLILLGVGAIALYIVFEPEKLQIIQQYLRSSTGRNSTTRSILTAGIQVPLVENDGGNETSTMAITTSGIILLKGSPSFPTMSETEATTETDNSTRYCDDCLPEEVCVALVDEDVPICRVGLDRDDPTGCAGFCLINKQKCHRLDVDAFRCVEMEHYCLEDEWTCSNTLCIPVNKRCDGHMNCYDHSDEYNCVCNLDTHFQCSNETSCLPLEKRCDGKIDCWDAADEINCTLGRNLGWPCPLENEFTCSNGQCILKARFCDGLPDCADGSDEPHGCQGRCNKHEFTCQNSRCITKGMKCNGVDDCGDGTDERYCKSFS